jgi:hypothetical protein
MKMEQTECSETLALKLQTLANHPEESIRVHHTDVMRRLKETRTPVNTVLRQHLFYLMMQSASQTTPLCGKYLVNNELVKMWKV